MKLLEILKRYEHHIEVLLEAVDYKQMFSDDYITQIQKEIPRINRQTIDKKIKEAKSVLKREDRIVWFLRLWRLNNIYLLQDFSKDEDVKAYADAELKKFNRKAKANYDWDTLKPILPAAGILTSLEHFLSLQIPEIHRYVFQYQAPSTIGTAFLDFEQDYNESMGDDARLIGEENETVFLDVGGGYKWFDLERSSCSVEAKAMGHCGNSPASHDRNQKILSLRQLVQKNGKNFWKPVATFIYHISQKSLGEMKGKNNTKPVERYHPYILKLLYDNRIQAIHGGGYLPEENFSLNDLDDAAKTKLYEKKPQLMPFMEKLSAFGVNENILDELEEAGATIDRSTPEYPYVFGEYTSLKDMVEEVGNSTATWIISTMDGDHYYDIEVDTKQIFSDNLSSAQDRQLENYVKQKYPDDIFNEDGDEEFDWYDVLQNKGDEWFEDFHRFPEDASRHGAETAMYEALIDGITELGDGMDIVAFRQPPDGNVWDSPYKIKVRAYELKEFEGYGFDIDTAEEFVEYFEEHLEEEDHLIIVDEPSYGWDGFDDEGFDEDVKYQLENLQKIMDTKDET